MKKFINIVIALSIIFSVLCTSVKAKSNFVEPVKMRCTVYCDYGTTKSGVITRVGIAAINNKNLGKTAILYRCNTDGSIGDFIGFYEILDTGGHPGLKSGTRIDIYCTDQSACDAWIKEYGDYVMLQIIEAEG